ncbi:MAG: Wzz/FepE/Etk N-terminal domain-containing protein [Pseudomonadota bacterium]
MQEIEEQGFDLLDLLGMVAENLKLLVLLPLVAGMIGLAVSYTLPKSYTSRAILSLPATPPSGALQLVAPPPTAMQAASTMLTPVVLDPAIATLKLAEGRPLQLARAELAGRGKAVVGKDFLLRLDVTGKTPVEAQATANAIIDAWLKTTLPGPRDTESLTKRLNYAKSSLESVRQQLARLAQNSGTERRSGVRNDLGASMIALSEMESRYSAEIRNLENSVEGLSRDVLLQEPTLPLEPSAPNKTLIAVGSALFGACLTILWVLLDGAWKRAAKDPALAAKQHRVRAALGFKERAL